MITVTALGRGPDVDGSDPSSSSSSSSSPSPAALSYLIRIDNSYLLLDCGAPEDLRFAAAQPDATKRDLTEFTTADGQIDAEALAQLPLDEAIALVAPRISLVLLSHSTLRHVGLYAYAWARLGLTCPAYAALPTSAMGRLVTLEAAMAIGGEVDLAKADKHPRGTTEGKKRNAKVETKIKTEDDDGGIAMDADDSSASSPHVARSRCVPTRAETDEAFENVRTLRYLQPTVLDGSMSSLSLTAHSAGHTLGGTVWKLRSPTSGTLVLAIDWNHVKERHIDGSGVIDGGASAVKRAEMLVTSGAMIGKVNARRKDKDKKLLDLVHDALTVSKSTLHLPLDASPRLLEVLLLLDQHWAYSYPHARFPLCLVSKTGKEVIERARTMREWMGRNLQGEEGGGAGGDAGTKSRRRGANDAAGQGHGPLEFRFLRVFTSLQALSAAVPPDSAKVVITVGPSLLYGPSLRFFREHVALDAKHVVVLTQCSERASVAATLREWWQQGQAKGGDGKDVGREVAGNGREIDGVVVAERVPLQGAELEAHNEAERLKREREEQHKALVARSRRRLEADQDGGDGGDDSDSDGSDSDSSDDGEGDGEGGGEAEEGGHDTAHRRRLRKQRRRDEREGGAGAGGVADGNEPNVHATGDGAFAAADVSLSHDIYLRGSASRVTNFFGTATTTARNNSRDDDARRQREAVERHGVGVRFRAFPVVEKRKRVDAFGEVIDVSRWLSRGRREKQEEEERLRREAAEGAAGAGAGAMTKRRRLGGDQDDDGETGAAFGFAATAPIPALEEVDEFEGTPTKYTTSTTSLRVSCRIACIDLEGLIDGRALSIVLPQLAPRRLVLVNTPTATTATDEFVASLAAVRDFTQAIYTPEMGKQVTVGAQVKAFDVRLGEGLLEAVKMGVWEEWSLGWIAGRVAAAEGAVAKKTASDAAAQALPAAVALDRILAGMQAGGGVGEGTAGVGEDGDAESSSRAVYVPQVRRQQKRIAASDDATSEGHADEGAAVVDGKSAPPPSSSTTALAHPTYFIGDVRLSKLKSTLSAQHRIPAEFGGSGILVCGSAALATAGVNISATADSSLPATANQASAAVTVQKLADRIVIEGNAGRTFVRVREAVYGMHARVGDA